MYSNYLTINYLMQPWSEAARDEKQHDIPGADGGAGRQGGHPPGLTALHQGSLRHQGRHAEHQGEETLAKEGSTCYMYMCFLFLLSFFKINLSELIMLQLRLCRTVNMRSPETANNCNLFSVILAVIQNHFKMLVKNRFSVIFRAFSFYDYITVNFYLLSSKLKLIVWTMFLVLSMHCFLKSFIRILYLLLCV